MRKTHLLNTTLFISIIAAMSSYIQAFELTKAPLVPSKLTEAWSGIKPQDLNDESTKSNVLLLMSAEDQAQFDFELAARWEAMQVKPALLAYNHLLKNGFNSPQSFWHKFLGTSGVIFGYHYDVRPSFREGNYTRKDRYVTYPTIPLHSTVVQQEAAKFFVKLEPSYGVEFQFYRQFKDPKSAILSRPYYVQNLPLTAENTIQNMAPGDLFVFNSHLDILLGGDLIRTLNLLRPGFSIGVQGLLTGGFQVHILRLPENKVRFKIFSHKNNSIGATAQVGLFNVPDLAPLKSIDEKIVTVLIDNTNLLSAKIQQSWNKSLLLDFSLDLNIPSVAQAFDEVMGQVREFNYMTAGDPRIHRTEFLKSTLTNIEPFEKLVQAGVIKSAYKTMNNAEGTSWGLKVGNKILSLKTGGRSTENHFETTNAQGLNEKYRFTSQKDSTEFSFFYSLLNQSEKNMTGVLANGETLGLVYSSESASRIVSERNLRSMQRQLQMSLPETFSKINFSVWNGKNAKFHNVVSRTQVVIPTKALQSIPAMSRNEFAKQYLLHLSSLNLDEYLIKIQPKDSETDNDIIERAVVGLSRNLEKIFNQKNPPQQKVDALIKLFDDRLFRMTGLGFLIKLVPNEDFKKLIYSGFHMSATNGPVVRQVNSPKDSLEFYSHVLSLDNLTNDEEMDLTIESEGIY